ncbi:phospholipase A and acyltransferase 3-like [Biomphalaria glabrata]|uniref:Phospholipase A and acyltransferase 3-like n=1 Tax=Biomphalaria glabrata TaxID=6526 RepID=A0A9W2YBX3_BIOGL|nr:phospholipase A and acyltransferase 3-like [Biomphalaria glabrata]
MPETSYDQWRRVYTYNEQVLRSLSPGDIVKFKNSSYEHWAIYVGGQNVIHKAGRGVSIFRKSQPVEVKEEQFLDVAGENLAEIANQHDLQKSPLQSFLVVDRARSQLGKEPFQGQHGNNEQFVLWCRYGEEQVNKSSALGTTVAIGATLCGFMFGGPVLGFVALSASALMIMRR